MSKLAKPRPGDSRKQQHPPRHPTATAMQNQYFSRFFALPVFALIIIVAGSDSPRAVTPSYDVTSDQRFTRISLDVDAGQYINIHDASVVDHIYNLFRDSGLFADVETALNRWPITVQIQYSSDQHENTATLTTKAALSAATLLIVPAPVT